MPAITQESQLVSIETPLGRDTLLLSGFKGHEAISRLFTFHLELVSENHNVPFESIVGENVTLSVLSSDGSECFFNGILSHFSQGRGGGEEESSSDTLFSHYTAEMVPWLWMLTQTSDSRIFQNKSVPDIIEQIFSEYGYTDYALRLSGSYDPQEYCVQYRETDFNFISRLMEDWGIYYFFEHEPGKHTLVIVDASDENKPCPGQETARYQVSGGGWDEEDVITSLEVQKRITPAKYTLTDYNFEIPNANLKIEVPAQIKLGPGEREIYDYPGSYSKRALGDQLTSLRMQEQEAQVTQIEGTSDCRPFKSGFRFRLRDFYRRDMNNKEYLITDVDHEFHQGGFHAGAPEGAGGSEPSYSNRFGCIPFEVPFRPERKTEKPFVRGTQTAIVTGPAGEEIYTEEHSRVKVQFHWDREGKRDENSSCWIRVSQPWAGAGWGSISIPRIGQEVIVDFLEGDPDRPIITGRVYHGQNRPPYGLPAGGVVSGLKSNSTPGGGGYNEMSMNDTKGEEKITIHAQYDMNTTVEHDQSTVVKSGNRTLSVESGTHTETIQGDSSLSVLSGSRPVSVTGGDYSAVASDAIKLHGESAGVSIRGDAQGVAVTGTGDGVSISGEGGTGVSVSGTPNIEANGSTQITITSPLVEIGDNLIKIEGQAIELSAGGSIIKIGPGGITISSPAIFQVTAGMIKHNG
jgi:type VI secretion system secreted protein VgrG